MRDSKEKKEQAEEKEKLKEAQEQHPLYSAIMAKLKGQTLPHNLSKEQRSYIRAQWEHFRLRNDVLYYLDQMKRYLLVLPEEYAKKMFLEVHAGALGGHLGPDKTLSRLQSKYFWPKINSDVRAWTHECVACELKKRPHSNTKAPLKPIHVPAQPWKTCGMDIVGPLHLTTRNNK